MQDENILNTQKQTEKKPEPKKVGLIIHKDKDKYQIVDVYSIEKKVINVKAESTENGLKYFIVFDGYDAKMEIKQAMDNKLLHEVKVMDYKNIEGALKDSKMVKYIDFVEMDERGTIQGKLGHHITINGKKDPVVDESSPYIIFANADRLLRAKNFFIMGVNVLNAKGSK